MIFHIQASAGAGKTYTLTQKYLSLLKKASLNESFSSCFLYPTPNVYSIREIIAATFTNKAAAEMEQRIITELKKLALIELANPTEYSSKQYQKLTNHILRNYESLQIKTIDSLLTTIVKLSALTLAIPPDFTPSMDETEYFTPVYDALMQDLADKSTDPKFISADKNTLKESLKNACSTLIYQEKQNGFIPNNSIYSSLLKLVLRQITGKSLPLPNTQKLQQELYNICIEYSNSCKKLLEQLTIENLTIDKRVENFLKNASNIYTSKLVYASSYASKASLDDYLNKTSKGKYSDTALMYFKDMQLAYSNLNNIDFLDNAILYSQLSILAKEIYYRMAAGYNLSSHIPAPQIPVLAAKLLDGDGVSEALCRFGANIHHLLLDEFQDTSEEQWKSLLSLSEECLGKGGSLTCVGDMKQAIYSWRGGNALLFSNILKEPKFTPRYKIEEINLEFNRRSSPLIIKHNNIFFEPLSNKNSVEKIVELLLPISTPNKYLQLASNQLLTMFKSVAQKVPEDKTSNLNDELDASSLGIYEIEAKTVTDVNLLVQERLKKLLVDLLAKNFLFSDIAILVRAKEDAKIIANWLSEWEIPIITENSFNLLTQPIINRLLAFIKFLDYPLNDLAFWEFISSSELFLKITCLEQKDIYSWYSKLANKKNRKPLFQSFKDDFPKLWDKFILPFYANSGLTTAYDLLSEAIAYFNLWNIYPDQAPFLRHLLELAQLAEELGHSSLAAFIEYIEAAEEAKLPLPDQMNAVRIMTIHKAKGLQFNVVIAPFHHSSFRNNDLLTEFTYKDQKVLSIANKSSPDEYYPNLITSTFEQLALLYVAWTRPVKELHIFVTKPKSVVDKSVILKSTLFLLDIYKNTRPESEYTYELLTEDDENIYQLTNNYSSESLKFKSYPNALEELEAKTNTSNTKELTISILNNTKDINLDSNNFKEEDFKESVSHKLIKKDQLCIFQELSNSKEIKEPKKYSWRPMEWLPSLKIYRSPIPNIDFTVAQRGTFTHLCIEMLKLTNLPNNISAEEFNKIRSNDVEQAIIEASYNFSVELANIDLLIKDVTPLIYWFATLPEAELWLSNKGVKEQTIISDDGKIYRADLIVNDEEKIIVVDYKTGNISNSYNNQIINYMKLLTSIYKKEATGYIVYLDLQRIEKVEY